MSNLAYLKDFLEHVCRGVWVFDDVVASVVTGTKTVTLTTNTGTTNQYTGYTLYVYSGDNADDEYTVVTNTSDTPTVMVVAETIAADLATDVVKLYKGTTTNHYTETRNINFIEDNGKILIYLPETIGSDINHYTERYMIKLSEVDEAGLVYMKNDIISDIINLNTRQTIPNYTRETTLLNIELHHTNKAFEHGSTKTWEQDLYLDVEWSTS